MAKGVYKRTEEHNRINKLSKLGVPHKGSGIYERIKPVWNKGKTGYTTNKKGKKYPEISGVNHHNWKGGKPKCINCDKELSAYKYTYCEPCRYKILIGEKSPHWKGGIRNYPYPVDWTDILKDSIRVRDNLVCQICGFHQDEIVGSCSKLDVHHIDYNKENCNPDNLIALCRKCHMKTNGDRDYWTNYFKTL